MPKHTQRIFVVLYAGLIVYGSLYPFTGWRWPDAEAATFLKGEWPSHISRGDLVSNLLAYAPLGYLLFRNMQRRRGNFFVICAATLIGTLLSFCMEFLQMFLPSRVSDRKSTRLNSSHTFSVL
jgi:VanZ family protein